jgi:signal transduction histidine kinase
MPRERRLQAFVVLLLVLAWGLDAQAAWVPAVAVAAVAGIGLLAAARTDASSWRLALGLLLLYALAFPAVLGQLSGRSRLGPPAEPAVAAELQARFSALEGQLSAWSRKVAGQPAVREALSGYQRGGLSQAQAQRLLFEVLPALTPPLDLMSVEPYLGLSVLGPSHELLAWSGFAVESYEIDLDRIDLGGTLYYIEALSLATFKVLVPIRIDSEPLGIVAADLVVQKPGSRGDVSSFPRFVGLLDPPPGYAVSFTPKDQSAPAEPESVDGITVSLQDRAGEAVGYLAVRSQAVPVSRWLARAAALRAALWPAAILLALWGTLRLWGGQLGTSPLPAAGMSVFYLAVIGGIGLFHVRELRWPLPGQELPLGVLYRLGVLAGAIVWAGWISFQLGFRRAVSRRARAAAALAAGGVLYLLLTAGMRLVVLCVQETSIDVWSSVGAADIVPKLMGHFTLLTGVIVAVFLAASLLRVISVPARGVTLFLAATLAVLSGASLWSSVLFAGATFYLSSVMGERFAHMRVRLLPGALGGLLLGFVLVAAYYPTAEHAAFQARETRAVQLVEAMLAGRRAQQEEILAAELQRLLSKQEPCQDLARRDEEILGGLAAHYWVESGLSQRPALGSSLMVLGFDGTPVSSFSTAVAEYGRSQEEFLAVLIRSRRLTSHSLDLLGRSIHYLGAPVRCGGVHVGFVALSLVTSDFLSLAPGLFEPSEVRIVELMRGRGADPADPRLLPPVIEGERQVGGRLYSLRVLDVTGHESFDQVVVLVRKPTTLRRLYSFLWAGVGSAVYLVLCFVLAAILLRGVASRPEAPMGLILRFADKIFLGFLLVSFVPVLIVAPVYRQILEDRLEYTVKERGSVTAASATTMILERGADLARALGGRIVLPGGELASDLPRQLSRDPVVAWTLYDEELAVSAGESLQPHEQIEPDTVQLREVAALGRPLPSFEDSQGQTVLQVILPVQSFVDGEPRTLGVLVLALDLFNAATDELLLQAHQIVGHEVELYSRDGYLQASSRWPYLQISSPSRRIDPEAFHFVGLLGGQIHTVIRKQLEQYSTFTTFKPLLSRSGDLSGFLAVSIGVSAGEELANELRDMGLLIFLVTFTGFLLSTLISPALVGRISKPLWELMVGTARVAEGDLDVRLQPRGDDEITRLVGAFNAMVGRLRRQRDELASSHRLAAWGEAARRVAHEIKNPLTPILLSTQHMRQVWNERSPQFGQLFFRCTDTIIEQVKSLQHIATEFSRFARLPAPRLEPGELNDTVRSAAAVFEESLPEGIRLEVELYEGGTRCLVDQEAMSRSIVNLIQNAIHAIDESGTVRVSTVITERPEGRFVRLSVADDGSGIPEELLPRLFEPYFSTKVQGTGLGLAIAKHTFDEHHCRVHVESSPGRGTTFEIDFPALPDRPD